jgi:Tfp pilus assembly protein PilO
MITLEELQKKITELEERLQSLEKKSPNKKIITDYSSSMVQDYILADKLSKKNRGEF